MDIKEIAKSPIVDKFEEAEKKLIKGGYEKVEYKFKTKDDVEKNPELLKEPMDAFYKELEGFEIFKGFMNCITLYPEGDSFEYKLVCYIKERVR